MKVFVLTDSPSPYQVELFNEIETRGECALEVGYLRSRDPERRWQSSAIRHNAIELGDGILRARDSARHADLVVFNYYMHADAARLISDRAAARGPWCFWGERPGFRLTGWAGRLLRKWKLSELHAVPAPIWGIGQFAVDEYRREFGLRREYVNLPYFSDLQRFEHTARADRKERLFLFSGSLIPRKGVDLLAAAFARVAAELPNVRLRILGDGELRQTLAQTMRPVGDRVEFVGFKDWDELPAEYARADVLCVPSRYDGWGLVVPEGLASGLPVIATDRMGAALEFLETGRNGWLIPAGDEDAIVNAMRRAALLPSHELAAMGHHARESVSAHSLANGAARFVRCAQHAVSQWSA